MRWLALIAALLAGFGAGIAAQRRPSVASIQGTVMDANTLPEEIEYWEVRAGPSESVTILGRKDVTIIQSLRQAKGRLVRLTLEPAEPAQSGQ